MGYRNDSLDGLNELARQRLWERRESEQPETDLGELDDRRHDDKECF
jgi:hypothetical protein